MCVPAQWVSLVKKGAYAAVLLVLCVQASTCLVKVLSSCKDSVEASGDDNSNNTQQPAQDVPSA